MGCLLAALGLALVAGPAEARCPIDDPDCGPGEEIPPDTVITSGPTSPWGSRTATFAFHSPNGIDPTFECSIDSAADSSYADCSSGDSFTVNSDGSHTFRVRATRRRGHWQPGFAYVDGGRHPAEYVHQCYAPCRHELDFGQLLVYLG
jgi:hypothetical protein